MYMVFYLENDLEFSCGLECWRAAPWKLLWGCGREAESRNTTCAWFISKHRWPSGELVDVWGMCGWRFCVFLHISFQQSASNFPSTRRWSWMRQHVSVTLEQICIFKTSVIVRLTVLPKEIITSYLYFQTPKGSLSVWCKIHLLTLRWI